MSTEFTVFPLHFSSAHICLFGSWTQENEAKRQDFTVFENHKKVSSKAERGRPKADRAKRLYIFFCHVGCFMVIFFVEIGR